jgi:hypothetical protein
MSCVRLSLSACMIYVISLFGFSAVALGAAPTITDTAPNNGSVAGGTSVTVTGTGFISGSTVKFGSNSATGVTVESSTKIKATSPVGSGLAGISVTNTNGTSASTPHDQFGYDPLPSPLWLGLNGNSGGLWLGSVGDFTTHNIVYDRGGGPHSTGEGIEWDAGELPEAGDSLERSISAGMIPVVTIEYKGYGRTGYHSTPDPEFPQTRTKGEEEEGKNTIKGYAEGFVKSASAILKFVKERAPGLPVLFEPMNEPWDVTTPQYNGKEYANAVVEVLHESSVAGIPLSDIYVAAIGWDCTASECSNFCIPHEGKTPCVSNDWIPAMYAAQSKLETEVQGWYFHPYGPPSGTEAGDSRGIESVPVVQEKMTSGQNNIIVSEDGYCTHEVNTAPEEECPESAATAATHLTEMLDHAKPYHEAGWLKALIVYSRNAGGFAMQSGAHTDHLTKGGEALDAFAASLAGWSVQSTPNPSGSSGTRMVAPDDGQPCRSAVQQLGRGVLHLVDCLHGCGCVQEQRGRGNGIVGELERHRMDASDSPVSEWSRTHTPARRVVHGIQRLYGRRLLFSLRRWPADGVVGELERHGLDGEDCDGAERSRDLQIAGGLVYCL